MENGNLMQKIKKDHPDRYHVWECCISVHDMGNSYMCEGTVDVEAYIGIS